MASNRRAKGSIEKQASGTLRVRVYAGIDPVTGRRHYLTELIAAGRNAEREADAARARLVAEVAERRNPRTRATVAELLERYLAQLDGAPNTLRLYEGLVRKHIGPLIGHLTVGQVDAEILDSLYAELRRCRDHCTSKRRIDHQTAGDHECDERCRPHRCRPLGVSAVRSTHFVLSGAFRRAVRWRWVAVNPLKEGEPPPASPPNPQPPTPAEAARILTEAWAKDRRCGRSPDGALPAALPGRAAGEPAPFPGRRRPPRFLAEGSARPRPGLGPPLAPRRGRARGDQVVRRPRSPRSPGVGGQLRRDRTVPVDLAAARDPGADLGADRHRPRAAHRLRRRARPGPALPRRAGTPPGPGGAEGHRPARATDLGPDRAGLLVCPGNGTPTGDTAWPDSTTPRTRSTPDHVTAEGDPLAELVGLAQPLPPL